MSAETAILYNVTVKVHEPVAHAWLVWLREEHIPEILDTGCFFKAVITQLLETDDSEGPTYAIQYHAASKADYNRYIEQFAQDMRQKGLSRWGDQFIAFRTVLQVVH